VEETYKNFGDRIEFIGINLGFREEISEYMKKNNLTFSVAYDKDEKILSSFGARIPTFILIDTTGRIRYKDSDPPKNVENSLEELLKYR